MGTAEQLREARRKLSLTQADAAALMGLPRSSYAYLERPGHLLTNEQIMSISEKLNIPITEITSNEKPLFYEEGDEYKLNDIQTLRNEVIVLESTVKRIEEYLAYYEKANQDLAFNKANELLKAEASIVVSNILTDEFHLLLDEYDQSTIKKGVAGYWPDIYQKSVIVRAIKYHGDLFKFAAKVADNVKVIEVIEEIENFSAAIEKELSFSRLINRSVELDNDIAKKIGGQFGFSESEIQDFVIYGIYPDLTFIPRYKKLPKLKI